MTIDGQSNKEKELTNGTNKLSEENTQLTKMLEILKFS